MQILVTGGAGYVGSLLVSELLQRGYSVRVLDSLLFKQTSLLTSFIHDRFEFIKGDIRDPGTVEKAVKGVDVVIHLAGIVGAPACEIDRHRAEEVNVAGTRNILKARTRGQRIVYASTGSVYGKLDEICTEEAATNPLSTYGVTKLLAEQMILESGDAIAYRFATAFGISARLRLDLLPNDFVFKALKNRYLAVYDRHFRRTFVHVRDIVRSYLFAIDNFAALNGGVYNVGSETMNLTKEEIVKEIQQHVEFFVQYSHDSVPDPDQRDYEVSYEKIRRHGFETSVSLKRGIVELVDGLRTLSLPNPYTNLIE